MCSSTRVSLWVACLEGKTTVFKRTALFHAHQCHREAPKSRRIQTPSQPHLKGIKSRDELFRCSCSRCRAMGAGFSLQSRAYGNLSPSGSRLRSPRDASALPSADGTSQPASEQGLTPLSTPAMQPAPWSPVQRLSLALPPCHC